jgi:hypothetical protein
MKKNTLIKHKKTTVICEESGHVSLNYNVLLITLEVNTMVKPTIHVVTTKLTLTCTNCDKINHLVETYHNRKRKVAIVPTTLVKFTELVTGTKTQHVKLGKIHVHYPYIICYSVKHRSRKCPKKIEVHNIFKTKPINSNVTTTLKPPKIDDVPINVIVVVTTRS